MGDFERLQKMTEHLQILREAGFRITQQRTAIIAILAATDDHPTAVDVLTKARRLDASVSVATIYRTLVGSKTSASSQQCDG